MELKTIKKDPELAATSSESNQNIEQFDYTSDSGMNQYPDNEMKNDLCGISGEEGNLCSVQTWAQKYIELGFAVIPVPFQSKIPEEKGWPDKKIIADEIAKEFPNKSNIALLNGGPSGGLCDVDIDSPEFNKFSDFLPQTGMIGGRSGNLCSHYFYKITGEPLKTKKYQDIDGNVLGEIRSTGSMTLVQPSVHPSGEMYEWECFDEPGVIDSAELDISVERIAGHAILLCHYPGKGGRNDFALTLAGALLRAGWGESDVEEIIERVAREAGDEEWQQRSKAVKYANQRLKNDQPVYGLKHLKDILGKKVVTKLCSWLDLKKPVENVKYQENIDTAILELNCKHAVVIVGGKTLILNEGYDPSMDREEITFSTAADFKLRYLNETIVVGVDKDGDVSEQIAKVWLSNKYRRAYDRIVFAPAGAPPNYFNLFKGFPLPAVKGDCSLYWGHIFKVICSGDPIIYEYVRKWMAHSIQKPEELPGVALVLRGRQGVGKGVFVEFFGKLFGSHYLSVYNMSQVAGRFNGHAKNLLLLHANEAIWGGSKSSEGVLKGLITDPYTPIEFKGKDIINVNNFKRLIVASNERWAVPIGVDDRRYLVLDVSDEHKEDEEWFRPIIEQMENGGLESLMYELKNEDISELNIRQQPQTMVGFDMKMQSAEPHISWLYESLLRGFTVPDGVEKETEIFGGKFHESDISYDWNQAPSKKALHSNYAEFCKSQGIKHIITPSTFTKELKKIFPTLKDSKISQLDGRVASYVLQPLEICRKQFEDFTKSDSSIWKIVPEKKQKYLNFTEDLD